MWQDPVWKTERGEAQSDVEVEVAYVLVFIINRAEYSPGGPGLEVAPWDFLVTLDPCPLRTAFWSQGSGH